MANKEKTLSEHAAYELTKAGMTNHEDPEARKVATDVMALVRRFEKQGHTDKTGSFVLEAFETLATRLPLTPITDDPEEWDKFEIDRKNVETEEVEKRTVWQSKRAPSLFSEDEGKTFTDQRTGKVGESVDHIKQAEELEAAKKLRAERKAKAEQPEAPIEKPVGHVNPDLPAGEAPIETASEETATAPEKTEAPAPAKDAKGKSSKKATK